MELKIEVEETNKQATREAVIRLRERTGMNRKEFCEYFAIPYRTMTDWELGNRSMPEYLLRLMEYKVRMDLLEEEKNEES